MAITNDRYYITFIFERDNERWVHIADVIFSDLEEKSTTSIRSTGTINTIERSKGPSSHTESIFKVHTSISSGNTRKDIIDVDRSLFIRDLHRTVLTPLQTTDLAVTPTKDSSITGYTFITTTRPGHVSMTILTTPTLDTLPQGGSTRNNNIIIASAVGSTAVVLLCIILTLVSVCIIFRKIKKSRQSCLAEIRISHLMSSNAAYIADPKMDNDALDISGTQAIYSKPGTGPSTYVQNVAYVCHVERDSAAPIYQEIPSCDRGQSRDRSEDNMEMCQNVAYRDPAPNRPVICVGNMAYASTNQI